MEDGRTAGNLDHIGTAVASPSAPASSISVFNSSETNDAWERWKRHEGEMMKEQDGWIKRLLLRSQEDPRRYHYITFWQTEEEAVAFSNTRRFVASDWSATSRVFARCVSFPSAARLRCSSRRTTAMC